MSLPKYIDIYTLAKENATLEGEIKLKNLPRVLSYLYDANGEISTAMHFCFDKAHRPCVQGKLKTVLHVQCQRCLQTMDMPMDIQLNLVGVSSDAEAKKLMKVKEPLMLKQQPLELTELIEEEIILAMPIIPKHKSAKCSL